MKIDWQNLVKDIRTSLLLSQNEMAGKLGVAFCTINRYENSHYEPTLKIQRKIRNIASRTGISFKSYFLDIDSNKKRRGVNHA